MNKYLFSISHYAEVEADTYEEALEKSTQTMINQIESGYVEVYFVRQYEEKLGSENCA